MMRPKLEAVAKRLERVLIAGARSSEGVRIVQPQVGELLAELRDALQEAEDLNADASIPVTPNMKAVIARYLEARKHALEGEERIHREMGGKGWGRPNNRMRVTMANLNAVWMSQAAEIAAILAMVLYPESEQLVIDTVDPELAGMAQPPDEGSVKR